ncbi:MAG TPA: hypothetical protein VFS76_09655 [Pyrinomonadaceae bacterium]|nr:hypothetical protein [Pyrinomonadaceae bacterium]
MKRIGEYILAVVVCLLILSWIMQLWRADLRIPFTYTGDSYVYSMFIKGIVDNGWYYHNPSVGAPTGLEMYDFPLPDNFHFLTLKLLALFTSDHALILNLFFLLTFPLTTVTSLFAFRQFSISYLPSLVGSLLYTFTPYHFFRGEGHLFYSAYYMVPLMVLIVMWIYSGKLQLVKRKPETGKPALNFRNGKVIFALVAALIIGSSGAYYSFFGCFLMLVAAVLAFISNRDRYPMITAIILSALISLTIFVNLAPSIMYVRKHGNPQSMPRSAGEAERFGLKIAQMLLPITGHRVSFMARLKHDYSHAPLTNENNNSSLGLFGAAGFLLLLGVLFSHWRGWKEPTAEDPVELLPTLSKLNLAALLLATIGGFGSLFALIVSPHIRSYNRISVYLAFFSLFAIVIALEGFARRRVRTHNGKIIFAVALILLLVLGVLDQTSKFFIPNYVALREEYGQNRDFIAQVEETVPRNSMIFQLPYVPFPEHPPVHEMLDYDHLRAYLHSKSLRWSYGAIRGRYGDEWQKSISLLPVPQFLESLSLAGFNGVYVDRNGYDDKGGKIESELAKILNTTPLTSKSGRFAFYPMLDYNSHIRQKYTDEEWLAKKAAVFPSVMLYWRNGFWDIEYARKEPSKPELDTEKNTQQKSSSPEEIPQESWRWCSSSGELDIENRSDREIRVVLEMSFSTVHEQFDALTISGSHSDQLQINREPRPYTTELTLRPGHNLLQFNSNGKPADIPEDPRQLVFRINNFRFKEIK